jgi:hypothetical protein
LQRSKSELHMGKDSSCKLRSRSFIVHSFFITLIPCLSFRCPIYTRFAWACKH